MASSGDPGVYFCFLGLKRVFRITLASGTSVSLLVTTNAISEITLRPSSGCARTKAIRPQRYAFDDIVELERRRHFYQFS